LGVIVFWLSQFSLYMAGDPRSVYDGLAAIARSAADDRTV